ncbi:MAG: TerB family tellurite resistance protein [Sphingobacteriales bacterium]|nr:TerB family tellurite resistance protein [Sphingobacteriales bacterium]
MTGSDEIKNHLLNLIQIMFADGRIADEELKLLLGIGKNYHYSEDQIRFLIDHRKEHEAKLPDSFSDRYKKLYELILMIVVDGEADPDEIILLKKIAHKMGFRSEVIETVVSNLKKMIDKGFQNNIFPENSGQQFKWA